MALSVVVSFSTNAEAKAFLDHIHGIEPEPTTRELRVASKPTEGKVKIQKFKVRAAYLGEF